MEHESALCYDAIYARQSIDKADSISVESQIEFCKYETRGNPVKIFADRGYSGKNTDRPEFQRMLQQLRFGKIRRVICYKLDRCSRSILDFAALIEEFQKYGVEFVSCTEKFDTSTPIGRAMLSICVVFAQLERETIQQRVSDAYYSRCRKGFYMGGRIPFGFRLSTCEIAGKSSRCYIIEKTEAELLKWIYTLYAEPTASLGTVVAALQEASIPNPRRQDGKWIKSNIGKILANPIYVKADCGIYQYYKEKGTEIWNDPQDFIGKNGCYLYTEKDGNQHLIIAPHEGIIESDIWLKCRRTHGNRDKRTGKVTHTGNFLAGKLKCAECGNTLSVTSSRKKNGKEYRYVVCPNAHGHDRSCNGIHGWSAESIEQCVLHEMIMYLKRHFPVFIGQQPGANHEMVILDKTIAQVRCEIEKAATKVLESDNVLSPYLNAHVEALADQLNSLICQRKELAADPNDAGIPVDYDRLCENLSLLEKRKIIKILIEKIIVSEFAIEIFWRG